MENASFSPLESRLTHNEDVTREELQTLRTELPLLTSVQLEKLERSIDAYAESKKEYLEQHVDARTELFALRHEVMEQREEMAGPVESSASNAADVTNIEKILSYEEFAGIDDPDRGVLNKILHFTGIHSLRYLLYRLALWLKRETNVEPTIETPPAMIEHIEQEDDARPDASPLMPAPMMHAKATKKAIVKKKAAPKKKHAVAKTKSAPKKKKAATKETVAEPEITPEPVAPKKSKPAEAPVTVGDVAMSFEMQSIGGEQETVLVLGDKKYRASALTLLGALDAGKMVESIERDGDEWRVTGNVHGLVKTVYITSEEVARISEKLEGGKKSSAAVTVTYFDDSVAKKNRPKHSATLKFEAI